MTFEELKQLRKKTDDIVNDAYSELHDAEWAYIEERLPFPFRKYQQVIVKLEVSEETRANMMPDYAAKPKNRLGRQYQVSGMITGYAIGKKGEIRPTFWGGKPHYSFYDKIISITAAKKQRPEKCTSCYYYKKGACYMTGGIHPTQQVDKDMFVCGHYYERRRL
ncbi:MAG: hypothetical protein IJY60_05375 [Bacteroides sp.]|nr:hypothetical protein [Bacteroides sp.]